MPDTKTQDVGELIQAQGWAYMHGRCHPASPTWTRILGDVAVIECAACGKELLALKLGGKFVVVAEALIAAYDDGEERGGSVRWENVDRAWELAKKATASMENALKELERLRVVQQDPDEEEEVD